MIQLKAIGMIPEGGKKQYNKRMGVTMKEQ
jgi:hypothetical protein